MPKMYISAAVAVVFLAASLEASALANERRASRPSTPLTLGADGTFQLSILEDLHFGESMFAPMCPSTRTRSSLTRARCLGSMGTAAGCQLGPGPQ